MPDLHGSQTFKMNSCILGCSLIKVDGWIVRPFTNGLRNLEKKRGQNLENKFLRELIFANFGKIFEIWLLQKLIPLE